MVDYFVDLASRAGHLGYLIVFLIVMLECQALLGLFMPGESLVLLSGFLAGRGVFDLDALIVMISAAAIGGDSIGFELGRHLGRDWLLRYGKWFGVRESALQKTESYFARHGGKSVFASHFLHLLRALMPFMAGASRMAYWRFLFPNAIGCILWASVFTLLGYFFGESWNLLEKWIGRAGAVLGGLLLLIIALVWLWRWIVAHEVELRRQWAAFASQPRIAAFRRRFAPQLQFVQDRLTPGGYLGLHLTISAVIVILACWWFGGIVEDLVTHDPLFRIDTQVADWFHSHATNAATHVAWVVTFFGSVGFLTGASLVVALFLLWRRNWYRLLALALVMGGGSLLNIAIKTLFHRQRPVFENPLATLTSYSFPSGHTMGSTLFYGLLALFIAVYSKRWSRRVLAVLVAFLIVLLIALSRVYLGLHYLSDLMGAMAAGLAWLAACETAIEIMRSRREGKRI